MVGRRCYPWSAPAIVVPYRSPLSFAHSSEGSPEGRDNWYVHEFHQTILCRGVNSSCRRLDRRGRKATGLLGAPRSRLRHNRNRSDLGRSSRDTSSSPCVPAPGQQNGHWPLLRRGCDALGCAFIVGRSRRRRGWHCHWCRPPGGAARLCDAAWSMVDRGRSRAILCIRSRGLAGGDYPAQGSTPAPCATKLSFSGHWDSLRLRIDRNGRLGTE